MNYKDVKTIASRWCLPERRVTALCRNGRVEGAKKENGHWLIPENAISPINKYTERVFTSKQEKSLLPLPIGVTNYIELVENYYYIDKTLMIKDFLDYRPHVSLFTRPSQFGKTLMMDMLKTFFEVSEKNTAQYFIDKKIWTCGEEYRKEQGQYPVISVTFKNVKYFSWEQSIEAIRDIIAKEYQRHIYLLDSEKCNSYEKQYFHSILEKTVTEVGLASALKKLSSMLHAHYNTRCIIFIDEYDTPIHQSYSAGYYSDMSCFMRNLFSGAFKDNHDLAFGFLTGILCVLDENGFSGLNNILTHAILEEKFSTYFGFTEEEIREMTRYYRVPDKYEDICEWYGGYRFGSREIFNPWSVLNYFHNNCFSKVYWRYTGNHSIIQHIVSAADEETAEDLRELMRGQKIHICVDTVESYLDITKNFASIYTYLMAAGYLKVEKKDVLSDGNLICEIAIPNKEISILYEKDIFSVFSDAMP